MMFAVIFSLLFAPLVFFGNAQGRLLGMTLWGMGMGAQESILKAAVAGFVSADKRGSAYGIFNTAMAILAGVVNFLPHPSPPRTRGPGVRNSQMI